MLKKFNPAIILCTLVWMGLIFFFSMQSSIQSSSQSMSIVEFLQLILPLKNIDFLHFIIRKMAHAFEYFVLGILAYHCKKEKSEKWAGIVLLICFLYACSDEFHQCFIPLRNPSVYDVILDGISSLIGIVLCHKILKF
ncbi:MAG: VanZ family protein [Floccifex porci]|uniref:VanZ family protein n=1 Tax=Floccifex porci TaxID=2606629 RepID=UPI00197DB1AA|nr:VanZ family protein [Floccifex porci]MCI7802525.1 VanZ family protein [Erysipelotrichaceae bacterium]MDD7467345.1 VanZ family protein [Floccifex porci]MDY4796671.1 VanZ family protein [Floccifex porci]